jgi:hypothetical protein
LANLQVIHKRKREREREREREGESEREGRKREREGERIPLAIEFVGLRANFKKNQYFHYSPL